MSACTCEPSIHGHELDCAIYPWCPHEIGAYSCLMPCRCGCGACEALTAAHDTPAPSLPADHTTTSEENRP